MPVRLFAVDQVKIYPYLETTGVLPPYTFCFEYLWLTPALGRGGGKDVVKRVSGVGLAALIGAPRSTWALSLLRTFMPRMFTCSTN